MDKAAQNQFRIESEIAAWRPARRIVKDGRQFVFRLYSEQEQEARCEDAIRPVGKGGKKRTISTGQATCEFCGAKIEVWDWFWWRLYGLCDVCHGKAKKIYVADKVVVSRRNAGGLESRWEKPGGMEIIGSDADAGESA